MSVERNTGGHNIFEELKRFKEERERLNWEGSFSEYLEKVIENPNTAKSAHQMAYSAITSRPDFFTTGKNALFGAEKTTERFIDVLKAGAQGLEVGKRIVILVGPPGSGKSTLVNGTKRGIEEYSRTDEGALYAIADCPMHEDPLHLIPADMRPSFEDNYGIEIEGDLCPHCEDKYGETMSVKDVANIGIKRITLSEKDRVGIGTFKPSDPKSQDITELVGSVDLSKLGEFGTASDPKAYRFDGELNIANRGIMEFVEMLKSDERFLYTLLDLTQDKAIKAPRFPNIYADEVILAHSNLTEYYSYVNDPKNEALRDRMIVIPAPYTLRVSDESKIHEKLIGESEQVKKSSVHISPQALETAATFSVLSRLMPSKKYSKVQKLKIYDGQETDGLTQRDIRELQDENKAEGMTGISPRFVIDSLSTALTKQDKECLTPIDTLRALRDNLDYHPHTRDMKKEDRDALLEDLASAKQEFDEKAKQTIQKAFVYSFEDTSKSLSENYLDNVVAFCNKTKLLDPFTGEELEPDETMMRSIEEQIGVSDNGKKEFRNELLIRMASVSRRGTQFNYKSHPRLKEAIEKKLFADLKDVIKLTTSSKIPNEDQKERIQGVERTLVEDEGYCQHCAGEMIRYVGTLLSRT